MVLKPHDLGRLTGKVKEIIVLTVLKESRLRGKQSYSLTSLTSTDFDTALGNAEPVTSINDRVDLSGVSIDRIYDRGKFWVHLQINRKSDKEVGFGKRIAARRLCGLQVLLSMVRVAAGKRIQEYGNRASSRSSKRNPLVFLQGLMDRSGPMAVGSRVFDFRGYFATVQ
jgi:hypothetical protein